MSRATTLSAALAALVAVSLPGCVEYYASTYGSPAGATAAGGVSPGAYTPDYTPSPAGAGTVPGNTYERHQGRFDRRDFREGDPEYQRSLRDRRGDTPLEERARMNRQERFNEGLEDRIDDAARRRAANPGGITGDIGAPLSPQVRETQEQAANRRLERSTQAERQKQKAAAEVRRRLLADQAAQEGTVLPTYPATGPTPGN